MPVCIPSGGYLREMRFKPIPTHRKSTYFPLWTAYSYMNLLDHSGDLQGPALVALAV